ncbi:potassium-transporting ATPase subunit C [Celerinatantimonas diazotrophica]|uniref:K+-transporting ATPase ATPase C chain n=1 Tax=Celerinatantimonas diazotrophica TaxID=412034 RepID=A0A4R1K1J0_9GAMM|nr:potassium-transporting ATPase subunit C [Celerinatantimonas diazotrophica]TCK57760.1 K+-transporting ATPase ATPase C chain [Celerinatantimonas diazotrophica]CAG9298178.1 Potassium-transporting ATPase KdpC subunit [Celerinatantimonas diazotrophica]
MLSSFRTFILLTIILGGGYPLLVTCFAQSFWPNQANGSLVKNRQGQVIASLLIGQSFQSPFYLHGRPSFSNYDPNAAGHSNWPLMLPQRRTLASSIIASSSVKKQPPAMLTYSGSGVDPDIPIPAAVMQFPRISKSCDISQATLKQILSHQRKSGLLGPEIVNVVSFNLALKPVCHAESKSS